MIVACVALSAPISLAEDHQLTCLDGANNDEIEQEDSS